MPSKKRNLSHRMEANSYPIDYITCATTPTDLLKLRNLYNIPEEVLFIIPRKDDVPSRPPRGYVTMHLESFKLRSSVAPSALFCQDIGWYASGSKSASTLSAHNVCANPSLVMKVSYSA